MNPEAGDNSQQTVAALLGSVQDQLTRIEQMITPEAVKAKPVERRAEPAWKLESEGEQRLATTAAVVLANLGDEVRLIIVANLDAVNLT